MDAFRKVVGKSDALKNVAEIPVPFKINKFHKAYYTNTRVSNIHFRARKSIFKNVFFNFIIDISFIKSLSKLKHEAIERKNTHIA